MSDARFEDGEERPLRLIAADQEDLNVVSAMVQDAVFPVTEMTWDRKGRRFAVLLNRYRWEDEATAKTQGRPPERVQTMLMVGDVAQVASQGVDRAAKDVVLSLLSVEFAADDDDGQGHVTLTLAGDGAIRLAVECLDVSLQDVTRPYVAPSGKTPSHPA